MGRADSTAWCKPITVQLAWSQCPAVESIPGKVSGAWVFKNTRMPATVFENLEAQQNLKSLKPTRYPAVSLTAANPADTIS